MIPIKGLWAVLTTAVAGATMVFPATACARNDASYQAGWAAGAQWATQLLPTAGAFGIPDVEVTAMCPRLSQSAEGTLTYYFHGGQIPGSEIVHSDFVGGCVAGVRSVIS